LNFGESIFDRLLFSKFSVDPNALVHETVKLGTPHLGVVL